MNSVDGAMAVNELSCCGKAVMSSGGNRNSEEKKLRSLGQ